MEMAAMEMAQTVFQLLTCYPIPDRLTFRGRAQRNPVPDWLREGDNRENGSGKGKKTARRR